MGEDDTDENLEGAWFFDCAARGGLIFLGSFWGTNDRLRSCWGYGS